MRVHSLLVESVYLRRLGGSACGNDFLGDNFDGCPVASREKKLGPVTRKGTRDNATDPVTGSVDHRNLVLEHHLSLFCAWVVTPAHLKTKTDGSSEPSNIQTPQRRENGRALTAFRVGSDAENSVQHLAVPSPRGRKHFNHAPLLDKGG